MRQNRTVAASKGFARACESVFLRSRTWSTDPKGWTGGPPNVQTAGGFRKGGLPPLACDA